MSVLSEKVNRSPRWCADRASYLRFPGGAEVYDGPLVDERTLARLLDDVAAGTTSVADAVEALRTLPFESGDGR